jgi:glutathione S-transferase/RNA polymerase-associated protein
MISLYEHPLSPYAQKVKIVLQEKGLPFEAKTPAFGGSGFDPEFVKSAPRGEVPLLVDGPTKIFDSTIICEYLEDKYPQNPQRPASAEDRARVRMIEDQLDTIYEGVTWAVFEIEGWGRAEGELKTVLLKRASEQIAGMNGWLERELGSRPYFNGDAFGLGDACAYPFVAGAAGQGNAPRPDSKLAGWLARVLERPSVRRCISDIGAIPTAGGGSVNMLQELLKTGRFKREYRDHRLEWMMRSGGVSIVLEGMQRNNIRFSNEPS